MSSAREHIGIAIAALVAQPMALVMALLALVVLVSALIGTRSLAQRFLAIGLAIASAVISLMMVTQWRWPG